jgi:HEAT repeat protein
MMRRRLKILCKINLLIIGFTILFFSSIAAQESIEQYLLNLKEPKAEDYVKLLYEGSHESQLLAVTKLMELGAKDEEVIDALVFGLQQGTLFVKREYHKVVNDFWDVRAASAKALGETEDSKALPYLYLALRYDHDTFVRSSVALAIGRIGQKESIPYLVRAIQTSSPAGPDDVLIRACVEALGEIGDKEGFVPLVEVMRGNYRRNIKLAARDSLNKIRW